VMPAMSAAFPVSVAAMMTTIDVTRATTSGVQTAALTSLVTFDAITSRHRHVTGRQSVDE